MNHSIGKSGHFRRIAVAALAIAIVGFGEVPQSASAATSAGESLALPCGDGPYDEAFPCLADIWIQGTSSDPQAIVDGSVNWLDFDPTNRDLYGAKGSDLIRWEVDTPDGIPTQDEVFFDLLPRRLSPSVSLAIEPTTSTLFAGHLPDSACGGTVDSCIEEPFRISVTSLDDPTPAYYVLPDVGVEPMAFGFDMPRNRVYVLAGMAAIGTTDFLASVSKQIRILAFDAEELMNDPSESEGNAALLWNAPVQSCVVPWGYELNAAPYLGVATDGSFLYFGCSGAKGDLSTRTHGAVKVTLGNSPGSVTSASVVPDGVEIDYFPVAGALGASYVNGHAAGERLIVMAYSAGTKRAYVFDAREASWTGARKLGAANVAGVAVDQATGRAYIRDAGETASNVPSHVYLVDTAQLPAPQGKPLALMAEDKGFSPGGVNGAVDPATRRVFLAYDGSERPDGEGGTLEGALRVYQDKTPPFVGTGEATDPDARTNDVDEDEAVTVDYQGAASGYGLRTIMVSPDSGIRTSAQGFVPNTQLEGSRHKATAEAEAVGVRFDDTTDEELAFPMAERSPSTCVDVSEEPTESQNAGSMVVCDGGERKVEAAGWSSDDNEASWVRVARARTDVAVRRLEDGGIEARATARAEGIELTSEEVGSLFIGEVRTTGVSVAKGRPGTAHSTFTVSLNDVRLVDRRDGTEVTLFACGWDTDGGGVNSDEGARERPATRADDSEGRCDPGALVDAMDQMDGIHPLPFEVRFPRRDTDPEMTGSDGGARATNEKDPYAVVADELTMFDGRPEVAGIEIVMYHEYGPSQMSRGSERREVLQLAGIRTEAQYRIGPPREELPPLPKNFEDVPDEQASLSVFLGDTSQKPLGGGVFELRDDVDGNGLLSAGDSLAPGHRCQTGSDGIGDCMFELEPGRYIVHQAEAPDGFERADDVAVDLAAGVHGAVGFTNALRPTTVAGKTLTKIKPVAYAAPRADLAPTPEPRVLNRLLGLPADIADFLRRNPLQTALFALLWALLGAPLYLATRRRILVMTKRSMTPGAR